MTRFAALVLIALLPLPALAQAVDPSPGSAAPITAPAALPLGAMRHQAPDESEVIGREVERFGVPVVEREQTKEQAEVDQIYQDVMRRSAPPPGTPAPAQDQPAQDE